MAEKPLINGRYLLQKYNGKGGWTYALVPKIKPANGRPSGYVKVKGTIDGYEINKFNLMPMKGDTLFMPIKTEIRKAIGKQAGDMVRIKLYYDTEPLVVPDEMMECLNDDPKALKFFNKLTDGEKKYYLQWIYGAKMEETRISRMATAINRMSDGLKMYDKPPKDE